MCFAASHESVVVGTNRTNRAGPAMSVVWVIGSDRWSVKPARLTQHGNELGRAVRPSSLLLRLTAWALDHRMTTVRMVPPAVHKIVNMVAMRHLFMSAVWTVTV